REEQRHIDRHAREYGLLDRGQTLLRAGYLDKEVRPAGRGMQFLGHTQRRARIVREQRRHLERDPSIHAAGALEDWPEDVGRARDVLDGELEEKGLAGLAGLQ